MKLERLAALCAAASLLGIAAEARELRLLSSWPSNQVYVREIALPWVEKVAEVSGDDLQISFSGPDVIPPLEQMEPVQAGVFDLVFTHPAYHVGTAPLGLSIDGIAADPVARRESGTLGALDDYYQGFGLKLVGAFPVGSVAFNFALKAPITGAPSLQGRKIRGTPSYNPVIEALGGAPVVLGMADIYSALQTGVIDGAATTRTGIYEAKWHEVSSYLSRPGFGQVSAVVLMNLDVWNALTAEQQDALHKTAIQLEVQTAARFDALALEEEKQLLDAGMQFTEMPAEDAGRLDALWEAGVWSGAMAAGPAAENLLELSRAAGLTK